MRLAYSHGAVHMVPVQVPVGPMGPRPRQKDSSHVLQSRGLGPSKSRPRLEEDVGVGVP